MPIRALSWRLETQYQFAEVICYANLVVPSRQNRKVLSCFIYLFMQSCETS